MQILAHRGSKGTHPENTLIAFKEAVSVHADGIELDVHLSKDNQLIVIHDETVDRTTDGTGSIKDMTVEELKKLNASANFKDIYGRVEIPTLLEVMNTLEKMKFKGLLNIEIKTDMYEYLGIEKLLSDLINESRWSFTIVYSSFNLNTLTRIHQIDPEKLKYWIMEGTPEQVKQANELNYIDGIHPAIQFLQQDLSDWENFGKVIRPWTVNEEKDFQFCMDHDVAGLHTDFPENAKKFVEYARLKK